MNLSQLRFGLFVLLACCLPVLPVHAEYPEYPGFEPIFKVGESLEGPGAVLLNKQECTAKTIGGQECLDILADTDPYERITWDFRIAHPRRSGSEKFTLRVTFVDEGAGLIAPQTLADDAFNGAYSGPTRQHSHTRLNTGTLRHAWFEFVGNPSIPPEPSHPHVRISGLQHLVEMQIGPALDDGTWQAIKDNVPGRWRPWSRLGGPWNWSPRRV